MATNTKVARPREEATGTIFFQMEGLTQESTGDESNRFRLEGVPQLVLNPEPVFQMLLDAGISNDDACRYTDELLHKVSQDQLAKYIASKIRT
jgi:hypothetical protein